MADSLQSIASNPLAKLLAKDLGGPCEIEFVLETGRWKVFKDWSV
jgi:hypothetical protein